LGALLMIFRIFPRYDFEHLFFDQKKLFSGFCKGALLGALIVAACIGIAIMSGNVVFSKGNISIFTFFGYFVLYILVAVVEELFFRSFPLIVLAERYRNLAAILITSIFFGLAHYGNPGFNWIAMVNISMIGALLAVILLLKKNIYWVIGIHFGWNFTQGSLLGYQVSGTPATGILVAKPVGPTYLSGGAFGMEASIFCTIVVALLLLVILFRYRMERVEEMVIDEIQETDELN
jgi:membrane protease YdiL (CAAX protease family)